MLDGKVCKIKGGDISAVYPLVYKMAQNTWNKLPKHVQVYIGLEDLIQEGTSLAVEMATRNYKKSSKNGLASFFTFFYRCLENYYLDILKEVYAEKRKALAVYSLDSSFHVAKDGKMVSLLDRLKKKIDTRNYNEDAIIGRIDAERTFIKIYAQASPRLRKYLIKWILQPSDTKFKLYGRRFIKTKKEFQAIPVDYSILSRMCYCLWRDHEARLNVCRKVIQKYQTPTKKSEPLPFREDELRPVAFNL